MRLGRSRSRLVAGLVSLAVLPWTIDLEQARVRVQMRAVIAEMRRSLHVEGAHAPMRSGRSQPALEAQQKAAGGREAIIGREGHDSIFTR